MATNQVINTRAKMRPQISSGTDAAVPAETTPQSAGAVYLATGGEIKVVADGRIVNAAAIAPRNAGAAQVGEVSEIVTQHFDEQVGAVEAEGTPPAPAPSPWRTIWFSPRQTIRRIIDADVRPNWVPVVALAALHQGFTSLPIDEPDATFSLARAAMPFITGVLSVVFGVLVGPFLLAIIGGWLGGQADADDIRQAIAWSLVPAAVATFCWIPILIAFQGPRTLGENPQNAFQAFAMLLIAVVFILSVWSSVLDVITLAEVQRFSILRALACIVILLIPFLLLGGIGAIG